MTSLSFLNEPEMIACLQTRYTEKDIYTSIGPILVAVNPFEDLNENVYCQQTIKKYFEADQATMRKLGPHVFQIANCAYLRMFIDKYDPDKRENQSILVNGESGAGKTESTKQVLRFLAVTSAELATQLGEEVLDIQSLVSAVSPITESFGNAKTSRNNNSSRFGKFIELWYSTDGYIVGAHIQTYLLETVRVTSQLKGERNYHIFYEVFAGLTEEQRVEWKCESLQDFKYVNTSGEYCRHDGESDLDNFGKLMDALATIDVSSDRTENIFKAVVAVLHIGNLTFDASSNVGEDAAVFSVASEVHVRSVCELLQIDEEILLQAVTKRSIKVAGNQILKNLNVEGALAARDVYAKTLYDLLFRSLLQEINVSLSTEAIDEAVSFIGVLDIFGFEYFAKNSFEQLCINFANEKLQDHFNYAIFKSEQEVYEEEGIQWNFKDYPDNSERLELFENKRTGLFLLCDEQLKIPKPSDDKLVKTFYAKCSSYKHFSASKSDQVRKEFTVHHFACDVRYIANEFVEKNRNEIAPEILFSFEVSTSELVQGMATVSEGKYAKKDRAFKERESLPEHPSRGRTSSTSGAKQHVSVGKKTTSVASQFSRQLNDLITKIRSTRSHFIRCIKPNNELQANHFDYDMVMNQLRCGGALGAVQVFHAGFPNRLDFKLFVTRYSTFLVICGVNALTRDLSECIQRALVSGAEDLWRVSASMLIDIVSLTITILNVTDVFDFSTDVDVFSGLQMGRSQVFMRAPVFEMLERLHVRSVAVIAQRIHRRLRLMMLVRKGQARNAVVPAAHAVMYISHKRRMAARNCVAATIVLQRRIRVFLAVWKYKRAIRGFTLLKAHFRGYTARQMVKALKYRSAAVIQTKYRSYIYRKKYVRLVAACLLLQTYIRGLLARRLKTKMLNLTLTLQCLWRGTAARMKTFVLREKMRRKAFEAQKRAAEAKADFMSSIDEKLKANPNLLFDMLGASEKIALLGRQNEALLHSTKMLEKENSSLREEAKRNSCRISELESMLELASSRHSPSEEVVPSTSNVESIVPDTMCRSTDDSNTGDYRSRLYVSAREGEAHLGRVIEMKESERKMVAVEISMIQDRINDLDKDMQDLAIKKNDAKRRHLQCSDNKEIEEEIAKYDVDIKRIFAQLTEEKDIRQKLQAQYDEHTASIEIVTDELNAMRQISMFVSGALKGRLSIVADGEAKWSIEDLNQKNEALKEELVTVKQRFSSVLGKMETFSLSKLKVNLGMSSGQLDTCSSEDKHSVLPLNSSEDGTSPHEESNTSKHEAASASNPLSAIFGKTSSSQTDVNALPATNPAPPDVPSVDREKVDRVPITSSAEAPSADWQQSITATVTSWTRVRKRHVEFVLEIRSVGADIRTYTVMKSYAEFKTMRAKLAKLCRPAIDEHFPNDSYSFSVSNEMLDLRTYALNDYISAVCGCEDIMTSFNGSRIVKEFLKVDEYMKIKKMFARDAGVTIEPLTVL